MLHKRILFWLLPEKYIIRLQLLILGYKLLTEKHTYLVEKSFPKSIFGNGIPKNHYNIHPWMCYPLVDFLNERLSKEHTVFEYGSGYSTLYFANRTKTITSVECNKFWLDKLKPAIQKTGNASVLFAEVNEKYPEAIRTAGADKKYDVIIVDGRMRNDCIKVSVDFLKPDGIMLLDDSWRNRYQSSFNFVAEMGFKHLSFSGMKPGKLRSSQGTIFYKSGNNCFGI